MSAFSIGMVTLAYVVCFTLVYAVCFTLVMALLLWVLRR